MMCSETKKPPEQRWGEESRCLCKCDRKRQATERKRSDGRMSGQPIFCLLNETGIESRR